VTGKGELGMEVLPDKGGFRRVSVEDSIKCHSED
jgi:hypothetical protein